MLRDIKSQRWGRDGLLNRTRLEADSINLLQHSCHKHVWPLTTTWCMFAVCHMSSQSQGRMYAQLWGFRLNFIIKHARGTGVRWRMMGTHPEKTISQLSQLHTWNADIHVNTCFPESSFTVLFTVKRCPHKKQSRSHRSLDTFVTCFVPICFGLKVSSKFSWQTGLNTATWPCSMSSVISHIVAQCWTGNKQRSPLSSQNACLQSSHQWVHSNRTPWRPVFNL